MLEIRYIRKALVPIVTGILAGIGVVTGSDWHNNAELIEAIATILAWAAVTAGLVWWVPNDSKDLKESEKATKEANKPKSEP